MAEYSRLASGQVVSNGGPTAVRIPFIPDYIEISNKDSAQEGSGVYRAWWMTDMGQGSAFLESANSSGSGGNYGYVFTLTQPATVAVQTPVLWFNAIGPAQGVSVAVGTGNITVANAGTYQIEFNVTGTETNQFDIFVNGVAQANSIYAAGAGTQQTTGIVILTLAAGDVLSLVNHTSAGNTAITLAPNVGGTENQVRASVLINQIGAGASSGNTVGYIDVIGGTSSAGLVNGTGFTTVKAGLALQYGPVYQHTGSTDFSITAANPAVITTTTAHNLVTGNVVIFSNLAQTATTGMQQIAGIPFVITRLSATTFSINWNASNTAAGFYTAFNSATSTGNIGSFKQVLYPVLYAPGQSFISAITLGATTTVTTTAPSNFVVGQEVAFRIPAPWGTVELNSLPNVQIPGSPIYGYVVSVTNSTTFVVDINSAAFTAFTVSQLFLGTAGRSFPQVVAVGDVNTGGWPISAGSDLYPSPLVYDGTTAAQVRTINGPAIQGAYINNTWMGFIIGSGVAGDGPGEEPGDTLFWRAYMSDKNYP